MTLLKQKQHFWFLGFILFLNLNAFSANTIKDRLTSPSPVDSSDQSLSALQKQAYPLSILRIKPPLAGGTSCENAPLICEGAFPFTGSIVPNPITDPSKYAELCFRSSIDNPVWYSFIAGATDIEFNITSGICAEGIQAAIVQSDDCSSFFLTNGLCCAGTNSCVNKIDAGASKKLDAFGLIIGKTYYLVIDGYGTNDGVLGSCDYTVELKSPANSILNSNASVAQVTGPSTVCPNQNNLKFKVSPTTIAQNYKWTIGGNPANNPPYLDTLVNINWGVAPAKVCVEITTTCAATNTPICKSVTMAPPAIRFIDTVLCQGSSITIGSETIDIDKVNYRIKLPILSLSGCDSVVDLTVTILNLTTDLVTPITKSGDLSCSVSSVTLKSAIAGVSPGAATTIFEWRNAANTVLGILSSQIVTQQGIYSLTVKSTYRGKTCSAPVQSITVNQSGIVPDRPVLEGLRLPCVNSNNIYSVTSSTANISQFNWTITGGTVASPTTTTPSVSATWTGIGAGQICVSAQNSCGSSPSACLPIEINTVPSALSITGEQSICPNTTKTYSVTPNANVVTYQWAVPSGASFTGQGSSSINISWGNSTGGQITMTPNNACGSGQASNITVSINTTKPTALDIQGPKEVCPGATAKYFVNNDPSVIEYNWVLPVGVTALTALNQSFVDVRFDGNAPAKMLLTIKNACQLTTQMSLDVIVKTVQPDVPVIVGPTTVCSNDNTNFNVVNNPSITKYTWTVPTGATISSGQSSSSIQVNWGTATSGQVTLEVENACTLKNKGAANITIKSATLQSPNIAGDTSICPSAKVLYSVPLNARIVSYKWTTTSDATIIPTANPNEYNLEWKSTGGDVCLEIKNDCGVSKQSCIKVEVKSSLDSLPITGDTTVCEGKIATFTVQKDAGASFYKWTVPVGSAIQTGLNSNQITLLFGTTGGIVKVVPLGGCASGQPSTVNVNIKKKPNTPLSILGKNAVCVGDIEKYLVPSQADAILFKWTVPTGGVITNGINTREITVEWKMVSSGNITVSGMGECGESVPKTLAVNVKDVPKPNAGFDENVCGLTYKMKATVSVNSMTWSVFKKPNATSSVIFVNANLVNTDVTVSELGDYTFVLSESNGNCTATDTLKLSFKSKPATTLVDETCDLEATQYVVKIKLNGRAPYSFRGNLIGSIVQDTFKSQPVASGSKYNFVIIDAFNCASDTLKGQKNCDCATTAGTLKKDSLVVCFGLKGKVVHNANAILDRDDTFDFILNKGTSTALGVVISKNKTGEFIFDSTKMKYNTVYYIHYAIGTNVSGQANPLDRCFAISNGIPIVFKEKLTANFTGDTMVCAGTPASLVFKSNTNDIFKVSYQFGNEVFEISKIKNLEKFDVIPSLSGSYRLVEVLSSSGCKAEIGGLVSVAIRPRPTLNAGADQTVCERTATLNATIPPQYLGTWRSQNASKVVTLNSPTTTIENLQNGKNIFIITIQDSVCLTYRVSDTVQVFLPIIPKGNSLALEVMAGDSVKANVTESAPVGTYEVTALNSPTSGRFALFSNGGFTYISDSTYKGVVKFRYLICSKTCASVCDTGEVRILVKEKIKPIIDTTITVDIPNAITPNGDGKNDFFVIDNIEKFTKSELTVFNRWGEILYRSKAYNGQWGGTNQNGQPLAEGTYYYILRLNVDDGKILRGDVTILR